jgi:hypothetical protein
MTAVGIRRMHGFKVVFDIGYIALEGQVRDTGIILVDANAQSADAEIVEAHLIRNFFLGHQGFDRPLTDRGSIQEKR